MQVWKELTMKFKIEGVIVTLQGNPSLCKSQVLLKAMMKAFKDQGEGGLVELGCLGVEPSTKVRAMPTIV